MSKDWEQCPRCESNKVKTLGKAFWFLMLLGSGSVLIWLGIFFTPLFFIGGGMILFSPVGLFLPKMNQCKDCNHSWKVNKEKTTPA